MYTYTYFIFLSLHIYIYSFGGGLNRSPPLQIWGFFIFNERLEMVIKRVKRVSGVVSLPRRFDEIKIGNFGEKFERYW